MTERRSLLDGSGTPTQENPNVFDDEYAEEFDGVADGFRPSGHGEEDFVEEQPVRSVSAQYANGSTSPQFARSRRTSRNSTRKSRTYADADNPFSSPDDDERTPSMTFEPDLAHRSISSASSQQFARTGSPRFGAGPSHPYAMYPQGTLARTPSVATQSTARAPTRHASMNQGPQHPYALYPQGVAEDEDDVAPVNPVPVGFAGMGQGYHRTLGPDGEDQDIIGADGHAEQLPPYTRYPEDGPEKMPLLVPEAPTALHSRAPVAGSDPTMDLMHNNLQPAPPPPPQQSMTDQSALPGGPRAPSVSGLEQMSPRSLADSLASQKSWSEKSWKEKRKTKFCGIPFWWFLLATGVTVFIAAVLGGVIGGFLKNTKSQSSPELSLASSSYYDASVIASPTSISPPTGTYALSLSTPQQTQAQCLTESWQQPAWTCDIGGQPSTAIVVGRPEGSNETGAYVYYSDDADDLSYGVQSSSLSTNFSPFITVVDSDSPNAGPAWYFQQFYDKLIVLPEDTFNAAAVSSGSDSSKRKRQFPTIDPGWLNQRQMAHPGDKPWFCVWNQTFIEGFVYMQQPVATSYLLTSTTPLPTPTTNSSPSTSAMSAGATPAPTDIVTTTVTRPSMTTTWTGAAAQYSAWTSHASEHVKDFANEKYKYGGNTEYGDDYDGDDDGEDDDDDDDDYRRRTKRQFYNNQLYSTLDLYPYVVKLEERRLPGNTIQPYCQQYQVLDNYQFNWVSNDDGSPIIIYLEEEDPSYAAYDSRMVPGGCHCQWVSGQSSGNSEVN